MGRESVTILDDMILKLKRENDFNDLKYTGRNRKHVKAASEDECVKISNLRNKMIEILKNDSLIRQLSYHNVYEEIVSYTGFQILSLRGKKPYQNCHLNLVPILNNPCFRFTFEDYTSVAIPYAPLNFSNFISIEEVNVLKKLSKSEILVRPTPNESNLPPAMIYYTEISPYKDIGLTPDILEDAVCRKVSKFIEIDYRTDKKLLK